MELDPQLLAFAEDPGAFESLGPQHERILTDRSCVTFSPGEHYWSVSVQRVRFGPDVVRGLAEVRGLLKERGRRAAAWVIGPSATPENVVERLLGLGLTQEDGDGSAILVLTRPPAGGSSPFTVKIVETFEEHLASIRVMADAFGFSEHDRADENARAAETFASEHVEDGLRLLAFDGDRPIATGRGWFSPHGVSMGGGATLASHRQRGAMGALIVAAWNEAVRREVPALVTFGGSMAAPALERIGFASVGRVKHLIDRLEG